jgi:hypothetical protein
MADTAPRPRRRKAVRWSADPALDEVALAGQFQVFALELLRALARGQDAGRTTEALMVFVDCAARARIPWERAAERAVRRCEALLADHAGGSELDRALFDVGRAGLDLTIEALSTDGLAEARRTTRSDALHRAVLRFTRACEREAQREGWSYIALLEERLRPEAKDAHDAPSP